MLGADGRLLALLLRHLHAQRQRCRLLGQIGAAGHPLPRQPFEVGSFYWSVSAPDIVKSGSVGGSALAHWWEPLSGAVLNDGGCPRKPDHLTWRRGDSAVGQLLADRLLGAGLLAEPGHQQLLTQGLQLLRILSGFDLPAHALQLEALAQAQFYGGHRGVGAGTRSTYRSLPWPM